MSGEELSLIREAFTTNYVAPLGPMVDAFEREFADYVGVRHCLAVTSGTAAMHLALRHLAVGPGDEVLASTLTFIGSVSSVVHLGAKVAFIDSDASSWNMDPELLGEELTECAHRGKLPRAVIPTDLYGQCANLPRIRQICDRFQVPVLADAAEAMGAFYTDSAKGHPPQVSAAETDRESALLSSSPSRLPDHHSTQPTLSSRKHPPFHAGYGARAAVYSFNGNKIITTSGGGMLASDDKDLVDHSRKLSQQARETAPHYEHTEIGYNYRMSNILAAIGRAQLRVLDQRVARKRAIFALYKQLLGDLPGIQFMPEAPYNRSNRWLTVILVDPKQFGTTNEQVRLALEAQNLESRPVWKPMHMQPVFRGSRVRGGKVSEQLFNQGLCLPSGTSMTDEEVGRIAAIIRNCAHSKCVAGVLSAT